MIRPFPADHLIDRRTGFGAAALRPFLKARLGITHFLVESGKGLGPIAFDELSRRFHPAIEIKRRNHGFGGSGGDGDLAPPATARFRARQDEMFGNPRSLGGCRTGFCPHQMVEFERQIPLIVLGKELMQLFRRDQPQNPVTEEFQPLIRTRS